jgi:hypothetical protein
MSNKKAVPPGRDGKMLRDATLTTIDQACDIRLAISGLAVVLGVMAARLDMVMFGVAGMPVRAMGMMRRLFVIAGFMVLGGFAVMLGRVLVMFGGFVMMLHALMLAHISLPVR